MLPIKKKFIVDEKNDTIAVQVDIKTFTKIERLLEDFVLAKKIRSNNSADRLTLHEAKAFYSRLKKNKR